MLRVCNRNDTNKYLDVSGCRSSYAYLMYISYSTVTTFILALGQLNVDDSC